MAKKDQQIDHATLKQILTSGTLASLYIFSGEESYLRMYYLNACKKALIGNNTFAEFNFFEFDGKNLNPDQLRDAIESYPAMAERKLIIVHDFDLYKMPANFSDFLPSLLADLPEYVCLIFNYDIIEYKPDRRLKIHKILSEYATLITFDYLSERELIDWICRRFRALSHHIDYETARYFIFLCGSSMTHLITEIEKVAAFCTEDKIKKCHIDAVCTPILDAVVFDLSDAITEKRFDHAVSLVKDLIAQKHSEIAIFSTISRHMQRLYAAKLNDHAQGSQKDLLMLIGSGSTYYGRRILTCAQQLPETWLREMVILCGQTDALLKSSSANRQHLIELALLEMGARLENI